MYEEFINYQEAKKLKELGFKEKCAAHYLGDGEEYLELKWEIYRNLSINTTNLIQAPTYGQAFRWFREKYRYYHILNYNAKFNVWILTIADFDLNQLSIEKHNTYEEAELACLKKLIEIVDRKAEAYN